MTGGKHLILVGLPGSGKTTTGKRLAELLSLPFIDLDEAIEAETGLPIPQFFAQRGEVAFRDVESATLRRAMELPPRIIATGGGAVLREENRAAMRKSGCVFFLDRSVDSIVKTLDHTTHPTLQNTSLGEMAALRRPLYLSCADYIVTDDEIDAAAKACAALWRNDHEVSHH